MGSAAHLFNPLAPDGFLHAAAHRLLGLGHRPTGDADGAVGNGLGDRGGRLAGSIRCRRGIGSLPFAGGGTRYIILRPRDYQARHSCSYTGAAEASGSVPAHQQRQPHVSGDLASLAAAAAIVGYLEIGRRLRRWMPLFVYACPVTGAAALMLTLAALATESAAADSAGVRGGVLLGWVLKWEYAACVVYLALGPGIVGHTGFNALLRWLTPLSVALAFQLEPLVGSLIGWAMGLVPRPGWGTWVGGGALLVATGVVTAASARRGQGEDERQERGREVELEGLMAEGRVEGGTSMDATASYTYTLEGGEKGILDREGD